MEQTEPLYGVTALAGMLGVDRRTVGQWVAQGCPVAMPSRGPGKGNEQKLSLRAVLAWREARAVERALANQPSPDGIGLEEAKKRKLAAEAQLAELELMKAVGRVVLVEQVAEVVGRQFDRLRARLLVIPSKGATLVAPEVEVRACQAILQELIDEALHELAGEAAGQLAGLGAGGGDPSAGGEPAEAAAEADGERVGRRKPGPKLGSKRRAGKVADKPQPGDARGDGRRKRS